MTGLPTRAGSKINRDLPPAPRDAPLIERLEAAGAVLVGALNMGEYAYDFTGENVHDGPSRNPHDLDAHDRRLVRRLGRRGRRRAGAARARLRHQRLDPRAVVVLRHLRAEADLWPAVARAHVSRSSRASIISGRSRARCAISRSPTTPCRAPTPTIRPAPQRALEPALPSLARGVDGLRIAVAGGYFSKGAFPEALEAVSRVAKALGASREIEIPEARARARRGLRHHATEGAALHLDRLRKRAERFRSGGARPLIAGAMVPAVAGGTRRRNSAAGIATQVLELFTEVDVILAPATPCTAPLIGQQTFVLDGVEMPVRPNIGIYTQPISFIGLPVVAVPVPLKPLPIGVQIIAAPWREDVALRVAHALEQKGVAAAPRPAL